MMVLSLLVLQLTLLGLQLYAGVSARREGINVFDKWYGYVRWAPIPIVTLGMVICLL